MQSNNAGWHPDSSVSYWVNRTSRTLVRRQDQTLRDHGFAVGQFPVLGALAHCTALSQRALAEAAGIEQPSMTEILSRMERDGIVERSQNPRDKREKLISLSDAARARLPAARLALQKLERGALRGLSRSERAELSRLLRKLHENVGGAT